MFSTIKNFFIKDPEHETAKRLYWEVVALSRNPEFFKRFDLADTLDQRFDSLLLHLLPTLISLGVFNKSHNKLLIV